MGIAFSTYLNHIRIQHDYRLCHMAGLLHLSLSEIADIELGRAPAPNIERVALIMTALKLSEEESYLLVEKAVISWLVNGLDTQQQLKPDESIFTVTQQKKMSKQIASTNDTCSQLQMRVNVQEKDHRIQGIFTDGGDAIQIDASECVDSSASILKTHYRCRSGQYLIDLYADELGWYIDASALAIA